MVCDPGTSITDWIIEHLETSNIFEQLGLDVSSGGKSLESVAVQQGLDLRAVLGKLYTKITNQQYARFSCCRISIT